ncbi:MAG: M1 family metallopeptidase [Chloroflexota bacterium]
MARLDPHSYADDSQPTADYLVWTTQFDFDAHVIEAVAELRFHAPTTGGPVDFDTRDLAIQSITDDRGRTLTFTHADPEPILGARLRVDVLPDTRSLTIAYRTSPDALALQWLDPEQTAEREHPFLYTQCQPIHARSIVPLQDTPRTRLRFEAELNVPAELTPLMAAELLGGESREGRTIARFRMPQAISPYLFAFTVGDVAHRDIGPRTRIWAEPSLVEAAANEFIDTETLLRTGETLFGAYDWDRYDILVLPPAFPYGGMENPRLTFLTPSLIVGDRSMGFVVAHELAHSWTGNLVSNANAEHFWLNEGGATYAERRILEATAGVDAAVLSWALGRRELDVTIQRLFDAGHPELTRLRTQLTGVDPDDAYTLVAYEKGALLLRALEEAVGRAAFDTFLVAYLSAFRFRALTSEDFVAFVAQHLSAQALQRVNIDAWLYESGLPANAPRVHSHRLEAVMALNGTAPDRLVAASWTPVEWQLYLENIHAPASLDLLRDLEARFALSATPNDDILEKWLVLGLRSGYPSARDGVDAMVARVGRMKYLRPLYGALAADDRGAARRLFERYGDRYHPIARQVVGHLLLTASGDRR